MGVENSKILKFMSMVTSHGTTWLV